MAYTARDEDDPKFVTEAVRMLRKALGESQQQFAYRMNTAVRTVARYETVRPPQGRVLRQLEEIALEHALPHLAEVFRGVLEQEFGLGARKKIRLTEGVLFGAGRIVEREQLPDVYDDYVKRANQDGCTVTAIRLEFDRSDGTTYVADVGPPESQTVTRGGKKVIKKVPRKGVRIGMFRAEKKKKDDE